MRKQRHEPMNVIECPMEAALDVMGGKWKGVILFRLSEKMYRFNELNRIVCGITARTLTKQLQELAADGLIERTAYPEVPPRVEYRLTAAGDALVPILLSLKLWSEEYVMTSASERPTADQQISERKQISAGLTS
ncbi:MAG: helix-turn-helix domain-containing protein [Pseudomonadota bacterium]